MLKLVIFDLDGTLAESKSSLDDDMVVLLTALLSAVNVAVISGGDWSQFETQLLARLSGDAPLHNLSLLPTCGTRFYRYETGWQKMYAEDFSATEKTSIINALTQAVSSSGFGDAVIWGPQIEDRGSQITFSALGQLAPIEAKKQWDPDFSKRRKLQHVLEQVIPEYTVRLGGTTSVDITRKGIDKAYGIAKLRDILGISISEMIFVGDALFPGGNDYPVKQAGVVSVQIRDPEESKRVIETLLACLGMINH